MDGVRMAGVYRNRISPTVPYFYDILQAKDL